jgi:ABC-2 type transport system ATP-binding protein
MKIITGYLQQTSGQAFVSGINVNEAPIETKKKIGYLPEANPLYYDMFVKEYLGFIAEVHGLTNKKNAVNTAIDTVGLKLESKKKLGQLSKGYKQRVGLAAALIHSPEVLILDEPTSGLDPNQIIEIREVIRAQGKDKTVLFSSHILQEVEAICDRVIIINKGELVADDKLGNLQKSGQANHAVIVEFGQAITPNLHEEFGGKVIMLAPNRLKVETQNPEAVRKQILQLALQHNLNIVSLQSETQSLEDIFRNLTNDQKP